MQLTTYQEGSAKLLVPSGSFQDAFHQPVFFNPHMRFNRSVSSLAFQASMDVLGKSKAPASEQALVVDGLCALGSRGIRYAAENSGVKKVFFVDANSDAVPILKKNIAANKLSKRSKVHFGDLNRFFLNAEDFFDFIEIDPFGSPVYFLENAVKRLTKTAVLSVTATDLANLCGAHTLPCIKHYDARPLHNEFQHESALRILVGKIARQAMLFDVAATPLFSFYTRHYVKTFMLCQKSAVKTDEVPSNFGFLLYCPHCSYRSSSKRQKDACPDCGKILEFAGPLWIGALNDEGFLKQMLSLNQQRQLEDVNDLQKMLELIQGENRLPAGFFDLHVLSKKLGVPVKGIHSVMEKLHKKGFQAVRTHYTPMALKSDAGIKDVLAALK